MELTDGGGGIFKDTGWVPGTIQIVEACPLDSLVDLVSVVSGVEEIFSTSHSCCSWMIMGGGGSW